MARNPKRAAKDDEIQLTQTTLMSAASEMMRADVADLSSGSDDEADLETEITQLKRFLLDKANLRYGKEEDGTFSTLKFFRELKDKFPIHFQMARAIFSDIWTEANTERVGSKFTRVMDVFRLSMDSNMASM